MLLLSIVYKIIYFLLNKIFLYELLDNNFGYIYGNKDKDWILELKSLKNSFAERVMYFHL